jgi:transcriptional regulator with XRE-family HTH domain
MDVVRFARGLRALRLRRDWRQQDLADAAGISRSVVARVEQGRADRLTVAILERLLASFGARLVCRIDWRGEDLDRLLDRSHAEIVDWLVRWLRAAGWECATEVSFNVYGERGSIDILAFHRIARVVLVVEVKSAIGDVQATLMALEGKGRLAIRLARERGWPARSAARLLVVRRSSTARRRVDEFEATFGIAFPDRAVAVRRWLSRPTGRPISGLWFVSPGTLGSSRRRNTFREHDQDVLAEVGDEQGSEDHDGRA